MNLLQKGIKKIVIILIIVLTTMTSCASTKMNKDYSATPDNIVYRLFPTQNMWTFIKLDTRNGQMWQIQYSTKGDDYRFETYLSPMSFVSKEDEVNGRFTLYSTQNMYNFILLDQFDGRMWQVQWSIDVNNRLVVPIK